MMIVVMISFQDNDSNDDNNSDNSNDDTETIIFLDWDDTLNPTNIIWWQV